MPIFCMNCGASLPDGVAFCDACGTPVRGQRVEAAPAPAPTNLYPPLGNNNMAAPMPSASGSVACPVCGASALPGEAFCDNCGASLLPSGGSYAPAPAPAQAIGSAGQAPQPMQQVPAATYAAPTRSASLVVTSPPPPATLSVPDRPEMIVGRSDPQSNSYPDVD